MLQLASLLACLFVDYGLANYESGDPGLIPDGAGHFRCD
jgi:hypothetical protein